MSLILFDDRSNRTLRPLTLTRPVGAIRIGILTIAEKWQKNLGGEYSFRTNLHLAELFPEHEFNDRLFINGSVCPDKVLIDAVRSLSDGEALIKDSVLIAARTKSGQDLPVEGGGGFRTIEYTGTFTHLIYPEDIFKLNDIELRRDFDLLTRGRTSAILSSSNKIIGDDFFAEDGATAECSTFNSLNGPVYLGAGTEVWEGSNIRGPFALCKGSQLKMGAKIYGATTIGPFCRVGGEVNNSVIFGYSSKGHEGFLGNSVLGEWCNIGAGSNNSNLKNNYSEVRLWDYEGGYRQTGLQFCGLIMGDHAKCGINTMFNTGTVAGVGANIYGGGYQEKFLPDFSWGEESGEKYDREKFFETTAKVFERRGRVLTGADKKMLTAVFNGGI